MGDTLTKFKTTQSTTNAAEKIPCFLTVIDWISLKHLRILNTVVCFDIVVLLFDLFAAAAKGQQEITITAGQSQYCFEGLSPDSLYNATVFVHTPNLEGPGVSTRERTREFRLYPEISRYSSTC